MNLLVATKLNTAALLLLPTAMIALGGCSERDIRTAAPPDFFGYWEHFAPKTFATN